MTVPCTVYGREFCSLSLALCNFIASPLKKNLPFSVTDEVPYWLHNGITIY